MYETTDFTEFAGKDAKRRAEKYQEELDFLEKAPEIAKEIVKIFEKEVADPVQNAWKLISMDYEKYIKKGSKELFDREDFDDKVDEVDEGFWEHFSYTFFKDTANEVQICNFKDYAHVVIQLMKHAHLEEVVHIIKRFM